MAHTVEVMPSLKLKHSYHDDYWLESHPYTIAFPHELGTEYNGHNPSLTFVNLTHILSDRTFSDVAAGAFLPPGESRF